MTRWTTRNHDTYATLHRDGSEIPTARFHVIAEAEAVARALNGAEWMRAALERCVAAMDAMTASAREEAGDMTDSDNARLWNAALDVADAALKETTNG